MYYDDFILPLAAGGYLLAIIISPLTSTIGGAFTGWLVGLFFKRPILGILESLGLKQWKLWEVGAFLGFVSGFFVRSSS